MKRILFLLCLVGILGNTACQHKKDAEHIESTYRITSPIKMDTVVFQEYVSQVHSIQHIELRAPFDGIMGRFQVRLGSLLEEGELLSTLSDNSKMWVYFNVPEAEYLDYASTTGLDNMPEVQFKMANNKNFSHPGVIEADFNNETGNIAFRATFPNEKGMLRHGETGNILMPVSFNDALIIPQKATFEILDKKFVYVVDNTNTLRSTEITIAHEIPHLYVVSEGLNANDKILVEGLRKVKNNQEIKYDFLYQREILTDLNLLHAE